MVRSSERNNPSTYEDSARNTTPNKPITQTVVTAILELRTVHFTNGVDIPITFELDYSHTNMVVSGKECFILE